MAGKHDEVLAEMEAGLVAQDGEVEAEPVEQIAEETAQEESAPAEEQTAKEEEAKTEEEATEPVTEELTEEDESKLSEKTRRQMSRLREEARKAKELEQELEALKKTQEARKPLEEAKQSYVKDDEVTPLPWEDRGISSREARELAKAEIERERRLTQIGTDADYLESTFTELNPNSDEYVKELAEDVYTTFKVLFNKDESVRLREVAEKKLAVIKDIKEKAMKKQATDTAIAKQEAEQAPPVSVAKPKSSVTVTEQIKGARTLAELEAFEQTLGKAR